MREEEEKRDIERIEAVFEESDRIWGYRNITKELQSRGMEISEYRVRRMIIPVWKAFCITEKREDISKRICYNGRGEKRCILVY